MTTIKGHKLNNTGSLTPQIMENTVASHRHGVSINVSDGMAKYFRQNMHPTIAERVAGTDIDQVFDLQTIANNPLVLPIQTWEDATPDDHFGLAIGVDHQTKIWIVGNAHNNNGTDNHDSQLRMVRCNVAGGSVVAANWEAIPHGHASMVKVAACGANAGYTYHHFRRLSDGHLLWFLSQRDEPGFSRGRDFLAFYLHKGTLTWEPLIDNVSAGDILSTGANAPATPGHIAFVKGGVSAIPATKFTNPANRVYVNGAHVEKISPTVDRVHVYGLWRTADADGDYSQQPYYVYCDNPIGNSNGWKTITGVAQPMPISWLNRVPSANIIGPGTVQRSSSLSIAIDDDGFPHFIMQNGGTGRIDADTTLPGYAESWTAADPNINPIMHVYWNGTAWVKEAIPWRAHNRCTGPNFMWKDGQIIMFPAIGDKALMIPNWGRDGNTFQAKFGAMKSGSEPNPDPVSLTQRGEWAFLIPNGDTPRVQTFAAHAEMRVNETANNTNPGPPGP